MKKTYIWEICQSIAIRSVHLNKNVLESSSFLVDRWPKSKRNYNLRVNVNPEKELKDHKIQVPSFV